MTGKLATACCLNVEERCLKYSSACRLLFAGLTLLSLAGHLEWGQGKSSFLFQVEGVVLSKFFIDPASFLHPFVIIPLIGQILLFITLFQKEPNRILSLIGIGGIGILMVLILFIGVINANIKTIASVLPFLLLGILFVIQNWKSKKSVTDGGTDSQIIS
jgi:hypothetical protein